MPGEPAIPQPLSQSRVYDLNVPIFEGMPIAAVHARYAMTLYRRHGDLVHQGNWSHASELVVMGGHTGTHLDALGHVSSDGQCFGGIDAQADQAGGRLRELDIASVAPIVGRGVLLDVAALTGVDALPGGSAVTAVSDEFVRIAAGVGHAAGVCRPTTTTRLGSPKLRTISSPAASSASVGR